MFQYLKSKNLLLDIFFLGLSTALSLVLISFYFTASNLNVTYPDWMIQAFRIKSLDLYGMTSWTHAWSNGMNFWRSYQFVPQFITLGIAKLFSLDVLRAMVMMVIAQFVLLRVVTYIVARKLHFSPFTAFFASIATLSIAYFWKAVGDYSLLFSFSLYPIVLYMWVKYNQGKLQRWYPYIAGLLFYVHPILGMTSIAMWAISLLTSGSQLFSKKTFGQFFLFLLASSLFWLPVVFKQSYTESTVYLATKEFLQQSLDPFTYFGLSLTLFIFFAATFVQQFITLSEEHKWVKKLFLFVALFLGLIYVGVNLTLPAFIDQFQYTRGVGLVGIGIIFCILPMVQKISQMKSLFAKGMIVAILTATFVEGMWVTSVYSPNVLTATADPVTTFIKKDHITVGEDRIWSPSIDLSSYYGVDNGVRMPVSYMAHLEQNHLPERLNQLITYRPFVSQIPLSEMSRINDYLMVSGVKYVLLEENSPFTQTLKDKASGYKYLDQIVVPGGIYEAFATPWTVRNAVMVSDVLKNSFTDFPSNIHFDQTDDQLLLDNKVKDFGNAVYNPLNTPVTVSYPTQETLKVNIQPNSNSSAVFINESYSVDWKASLNGEQETITPVGPNFMLVSLKNAQDGGVLELKHSWPFYYSYLIFAIPVIPVSFWFMEQVLTINMKFGVGSRRNRRRRVIATPSVPRGIISYVNMVRGVKI